MKVKTLLFAVVVALAFSCQDNQDYIPKPRGYFRIGLPEKEYQVFEGECPFSFEYNQIAELKTKGQYCWADIEYPSIHGTIQLTYKGVDKDNDQDLARLLEEGRGLAFKHAVKADGIEGKVFTNYEERVFGILYQIQGDAATSRQFVVTDSTDHFLRGVLYFDSEPNEDSLQPVNDFMNDEIVRLIESLKWEN